MKRLFPIVYLRLALLSMFGELLLPQLALASFWTEVPGPVVNGNDTIHSIAAVSDDDIWAVGSYIDSGTFVLLEHLDGSTWSTVPGESPGPKSSSLAGVTALASNDVWAVGNIGLTRSLQQTLVEHWNGSSWTAVPSPNMGSSSSFLTSISGVSSNDIWAVGYWGSGLRRPFALHWDGVAWTVSPMPRLTDAGLYSVAAIATDDVWAVGHSGQSILCDPDLQTVTLHWNGINWKVIPSPNVGTGGSVLTGVAALANNNVWAVGFSGCEGVDSQTLTMKWNGTVWNVIPSGNLSGWNTFNAIVAVPPKTLWAAGGHEGQPITELWTGSQWKVIPVPPVVSDAELDSLTVTPTQMVWGLGFQGTGADQLFLRRAP